MATTYTNVIYNTYKDITVFTSSDGYYEIRGYFKLYLLLPSVLGTSSAPYNIHFSNITLSYSTTAGWTAVGTYTINTSTTATTAALGISLVGYYFNSLDIRSSVAGIKTIHYIASGETEESTQDCISCGKVWLKSDDIIQSIDTWQYPTQNWKFLVNDAFGIDDTGRMYAVDATVIGQISATSGSIGKFNIDSNGLAYSGDDGLITLKPDGLNINNKLYIGSDNWIRARNGAGFYFDSTGSGSFSRKLTITYNGEEECGAFWTGKYSKWTFSIAITDTADTSGNTWTSKGYDIPITLWVKTLGGDQYTTNVTITAATTSTQTVEICSSNYFLGLKTSNKKFGSFNAFGFSATSTANTMERTEYSSTVQLGVTGHLIPTTTDTYDLGSSEYKWNNTYCKNGTWTGSDRNIKNSIVEISDKYEQVFDELKPVSYKFNDGVRTHIGLVAQDVEQAILDAGLTTQDYACIAINKNSEDKDEYSLRYEEFIALNMDQIQKLKKRIATLETKIKKLEK